MINSWDLIFDSNVHKCVYHGAYYYFTLNAIAIYTKFTLTGTDILISVLS